MNSTRRLTAWLAGLALLFAAALDDAWAYERYRGSPGCDDCHSGFISRGPLHDLHQGNSQMTNSCDLCHDSTGDNPLTYASGDAEGQSCRGCHGIDNGTAFGWGAGLRLHHAAADVGTDSFGATCADCHADDPAPSPEAALPPYYGRSDVNITGPCLVSSESGGEDWNGDGLGLDNDGDLLYENADPDCGTPIESATWGQIRALYR